MISTGHLLRSGIGAALRAERERRHISLEAVARGTLVRQDFLELIDEDRLEALPSGAYAKGFIRAYAAYLGLDPRPFLRAYDERCGRPAPELARVVRRGVRVPPRAYRRAWKLAIFGASALVVLLAFLGAFRSGDGTADLSAVRASAGRLDVTSAPTVAGAVVRVSARGDTWVAAEVDGHPVFGAVLHPGDQRTFKGHEQVVISAARGSALDIVANGHVLGSPPPGAYRGVFTAGTTTMPPNEPVPPVAPPPSAPPSKADLAPAAPAASAVPSVPQSAYTGQ